MICPNCKSEKVITGRVKEKYSDGSGGGISFYPDDIKFFTLKKFVPLVHETLSACAACGHVWGRISAAELAELIERSGKDELKKRFFDR